MNRTNGAECCSSMSGVTTQQDDMFFVSEFSEQKAVEFSARILKFAIENQQKPIVIYIDTLGGDAFALGSMLAAIDAVPNQLITAALGKCMSAGSILLSHGDVRFVSPYSRIMLHEMSAAAIGNINDMNNETIEISKMNEFYLDLLVKNCKIKGGKKKLKKLLEANGRRELYLNPQEAIEFGLADQIGVPKMIEVAQYNVIP